MIKSPILNDFIKINLYDRNGGRKTEIIQKFILQVSVHELHTDATKKSSTDFSKGYNEKLLVCISDSSS